MQFNNFSLLADYINNDTKLSSKLTLKWATLSEYFAAQLQNGTVSYPEVGPGVDFVPYTFLDFYAFWSGFYASRPVSKGIFRYLHSELQSTERLFTLAKGLFPKGARLCLLALCLSSCARSGRGFLSAHVVRCLMWTPACVAPSTRSPCFL